MDWILIWVLWSDPANQMIKTEYMFETKAECVRVMDEVRVLKRAGSLSSKMLCVEMSRHSVKFLK